MKPIKILIVTGNLEVPGTVGNHLAAITQEELLALTVRTLTVNSQWTDVQHLHLADAVGTKLGILVRTCCHLDDEN